MRRSAVLLCHDPSTLHALKAALEPAGMEAVICRSSQEAMEFVVGTGCAVLIADFDLPNSAETLKTAALLPLSQRPLLVAMTATLPWPGTGEAFQSGADRILYKPLEMSQVKDVFASIRTAKAPKDGRKAPRIDIKTIVYLELEHGTVPAIGVNISECGFAVQATEPIPMSSNLAFHCILPGTGHKLHGYVDVIWTDDQGRAGAFFSRMTPASRKHLKRWLSKHGVTDKEDNVRVLMQPEEAAAHSLAAK